MRKLGNCASVLAAASGLILASCNGNDGNTFRYLQVSQQFALTQQVNTSVDMLWVIDNSASMDRSQQRLRQAISGFASQYLKANWDIRIAVITTDTYLANPAFSGYVNSVIPNTTGWVSPYIKGRLSSFVNPSWNPDLVNLSTGAFTNGMRYDDDMPAWGPNYAKLLAGIHDGPITALCSEADPYFFYGLSQCQVRDSASSPRGTAGCLSPTGSQSSISQCVNTVENDTVHSGRAILTTVPPSGVDPAAWAAQMQDDFIINASVGTTGEGSPRGMGAVLQLMSDNEGGPDAFFRKGSTRVIMFLSDADDQTMVLPSPAPAGYSPWTNYSSTGCPSKTVDGYTYTPTPCPSASRLVPVPAVKGELDQFFQGLDGSGSSGNPNYMVVSITPTSAATIQALNTEEADDDSVPGNTGVAGADRGDRYIDLVNLVGNGSFVTDLNDTDLSGTLTSIGQAVVTLKGTFLLSRPSTGSSQAQVFVIHADGTEFQLATSQFTLSGNVLTITDQGLMLSLSSTDRIGINYQPATAF